MKTLRILVGCEYSGAVRDAFRALGHEAASCDLLPTDVPGPHYQGDVMDLMNGNAGHIPEVSNGPWDLAIFHPPCTHLAVSGAKHFAAKRADGRQQAAVEFFMALANFPVDHYAIENPVCIMSSVWRKPDCIIQPYEHGHEATKTTCLWLKGLPHLKPTNIVGKGERHVTKSGKSLPKWYNLPPSADRWKIRSATYPGIAAAMAAQWSAYLTAPRESLPA